MLPLPPHGKPFPAAPFAAAAVSLALLAACASAPLPPDVKQFVEHRDVCDHLWGQVRDQPDPQRIKQVLVAIESSCRGTDAELARLRQRYRDDGEIMRRLDRLDARVE